MFYVVYWHKGYYCKRNVEANDLEEVFTWMNKIIPGARILLIRCGYPIVYKNLGRETLFSIGEDY